MISYGAVVGGPECDFFMQISRSVARLMVEERKGADSTNKISPPLVNIVYHLPGSIAKPDYRGMRTAKFSKKDSKLMIQVSVEEAIVSSRNHGEVAEYIAASSIEALYLAQEKFTKSKINYDPSADIQAIQKWEPAKGHCRMLKQPASSTADR